MLIEALLAIGLLATVLGATVTGLATGERGVGTFDNVTTAYNIARSQLEYSLNDTYCAPPCTYTTITTPAGYSVTADAQVYTGADTNLSTIVVSVYQGGELVATVKGVKANR